jgi:peptidyl-prolyl cis-trans isomerase A (cyclophilin A)
MKTSSSLLSWARGAALAAGLFAAAAALAAKPAPAAAANTVQVKLATSMGDIMVEVYPDKAPKTVENFLQYVKDKHFDGTIFNRVIKGFVIQTGGVTEQLWPRPTRPAIPLEAKNGLSNARGTLAMARGEPNSATDQFFINVDNNTGLDVGKAGDKQGYAVFGKVVTGMNVVDKIAGVKTGKQNDQKDVPVKPIFLTSATIVAKDAK